MTKSICRSHLLAIALAQVAALGFGAGEPARIIVVSQTAATAKDDNPGTEQAPLRTISAAALHTHPGDTVLVHAGIYRERVSPPVGGEEGRPIVYQAARGEQVVVRGSDVIDAWVPVSGMPGVFSTPVAKLVSAGANPYLVALMISPGEKKGDPSVPWSPPASRPVADPRHMPRTLGLVFAGGQPLREVESAEAVASHAMTWTVTADGQALLANFGCNRLQDAPRPIEVAVRSRLFASEHRFLGWIVVRGFIFEHCANPGPYPQAGAVATRAGHHWLIEDNVVRFAKTIGIDIGYEHWNPRHLPPSLPEDQVRRPGHDTVVRNNTVSDNGVCGIGGGGNEQCIVASNLVERNGWLDLDCADTNIVWEEWAGIKLPNVGALIEGNVVRDNEAHGIWLDVARGSRVTRNVVLNNKGMGIMVELGAGDVRIDNNLVAMTRHSSPFYDGTGIYAHDSAGLTVAHNLVFGNAGAGIELRVVTKREIDGKPVNASGCAILNNVVLNNARVAISLPGNDPLARDLRCDWNILAGNREYWQGMEAGWSDLCAINRFNLSFSYDQVRAQADAARHAAGQGPLPAAWARNPVLDLATWRAVTGFDLHSKEAPVALRVLVRSLLPSVRLDHDGSLSSLACPLVPGIERDLAGAPMPAGPVFPGPFQALAKGRTEIILPAAGARP